MQLENCTIHSCHRDYSNSNESHSDDISSNNERIEGKFAVMEEMLKKLLELKTNPTTSEARETIGGHGRGGNPNMSRGRENPEIEILESKDDMPPLEPLSREERSTVFERRVADFLGKMKDFNHRGAEFERGRGGSEGGDLSLTSKLFYVLDGFSPCAILNPCVTIKCLSKKESGLQCISNGYGRRNPPPIDRDPSEGRRRVTEGCRFDLERLLRIRDQPPDPPFMLALRDGKKQVVKRGREGGGLGRRPAIWWRRAGGLWERSGLVRIRKDLHMEEYLESY
ncbi:hypothetical protein M5K25_016673 [Dendrobium thyrsiflorum]|uniref:Uncharacterized protein n=1 Tax=Dendrobium thyrsiflorum TaxID=117978 RepID=A0ABD0UKC9_DENTH